MGRAPCCDKANVKKGPWSPEEDAKLKDFIEKFGTGGNWIALPQKAGLKRCGKSCRLRWLNYLRPNIKHGEFSEEEDRIICTLYASIGSRWSIIAAQLPGRTDNDIKNYWNTKLKKKLMAKFSPSSLNINSSGLTSSQNQSQLPLSTLSHLYNSFYNQINNNNSLPQNNNLPLFTTTQYSYNYQPISQDQGLMDFNQYYTNNNINPVKESMLMFGGNHEASCSNSSDGSCSHISYGKDRVKQEDQIGCFQGNFIGNGSQENHKFMLHYGDDHHPSSFVDDHHNANGVIFENSQLQYDLEEVKQLISSGNNGNFLFIDENKTQEVRPGMYNYY